MTFLISFLCRLGRALLSLRYTVKVVGLEGIKPQDLSKKGGLLILPNHPAHIDPILIFLYLWPKFHMRPLVIEYVYRQSILQTFMKLVRALPIPNFETSINEFKLKKGEESLQKIIQGLHKNNAFLLYPGGRLKHTGKEILGGVSATYNILQKCPDANVLLIRTTGLWGSIFSRAIEHRSPDIKKTVKKGFKILLKNLLFFAPRRKVLIELFINPQDLPVNKSRVECNRYLEDWFNRYKTQEGTVVDEEPLNLISYSFWHKVYPYIQREMKKKKEATTTRIPEEQKQKIYRELSQLSKHPIDEIQLDHNLALDLGLDSLDIAQLVAFLSDNYDIREIHPEDLETVRDLLELSVGHTKTAQEEVLQAKFRWPEEKDRLPPEAPSGKTLPEAFLRMCDRMGGSLALADDLVGALSYKKLKLAAIALALEFQKIPGKHVAIMLPASVGAYITILATIIAGKIPVMLNWTQGPKFLNDTMEITKCKVVISSWRFLERLAYVEFGEVTHKIKFLEDIRRKITLFKKLKALFYAIQNYRFLLRAFSIDTLTENEEAAILFTSGTETLPKGVPLSHKNLLSNQYAAIQCISIGKEDIFYSALPPFHSFGFSVAGLFPLLAGIKVAFSPDPTDSFSLAKGIARWKATIFCGAPSFLKGLFHAASKFDLATIRLFVSGAEKAPAELYEKVKSFGKNKTLIEGYGITECSPILTLNRVGLPQVGVGQLLPGIDLCTIHPETQELLAEHAEGEICVRGPNIFKGYLGNVLSPFIEINGRQWYKTGDLGYLDTRGNLLLSGRLKRFAKIGGEMVSLGAIEEVFTAAFKGRLKDDGKPYVAICVNERDDVLKSSLVLFTTIAIDKTAVNEILKNAGYSRLIKIAQVKKLDVIPITGTGKTNYRLLQTMIPL